MDIRRLEPADANAVAALWLIGAHDSAQVDPHFGPALSLKRMPT